MLEIAAGDPYPDDMSNRQHLADEPNHFFIPRHELTKLKEILSEIPSLAADLPDTITKQARLGEVGRGCRHRRPSEQPLPFHVDAAQVAADLHNALTGWVRLVCEQRAMEYMPIGYLRADFVGPLQPGVKRVGRGHVASTAEMARWLERHMVALAMTEGSETALDELGHLADTAHRLICPPQQAIVIDKAKEAMARAQLLNANGIATLAKELGEEYRHLTRRRVHVLKEAGLIHPLPGPWMSLMFRVGDVLDAHLALPIRERHAKAS